MDLVKNLTNGIIMHGSRYLIFAGVAYIVFYLWKKKWKPKINPLWPRNSSIYYEMAYSLCSILIFAILGLIIYSNKEYTLIYIEISDYPIWHLPFSFILSIIIHDTYFYWIHRLMHHPKLFRIFHKVHHHSNNPTPWAAYSFHPLEGIIEAGILPVLVFTIPLYKGVLFAFLIWQVAYNVLGHLGFEIFHNKFLKTRLGKVFNTSTHHNMHHSKFKGNYGLYFRFWDKVMGTEFENYEETYNKITK
jgi:Delta7-sterol 5-desaturase